MALSLVVFPDEVLASILSCPAASDMVVSLWLCGDSALNTRLSRRGCTSFSADVEEVRRLPGLLAKLPSLKRVAFRANYVHQEVEPFLQQLRKLPSTLEELEMELPIAWELFVSIESGASRWNVCDLFPRLRVLKAAVKHKFNNRPLELDPNFMRGLPDSLIDLHFNVPVVDFAALPRNLEHLHIANYGYIVPSKDLADLPPKLKSCFGINLDTRGGNWSYLPPTILSSEFRLVLLTKTISSTLPPLIDTLKISSAEQGVAFPSNLTYLSVPWIALSLSDTAWLPRTLVTLKALSVDWDPAASLHKLLAQDDKSELYAVWPPMLSTLRITSCLKSLSKEPKIDYLALPRTLTRLSGIEILNGSTNLSDLPPLLTRLKFTWAKLGAFGNLMLPSGLRQVKSTAPCYYIDPWLPSGLTALYLPKTTHSLVNAAHLPPTIETLVLRSVDAALLSALPSALTSLSSSSIEGDVDETAFAGLPSQLRTLELTFNHAPSFDFGAFKHVPRKLRVLQLKHFRVPLSIFAHLPTTVLRVEALEVVEFSAEISAQLPVHWLSYLLSQRVPYSSQHIGMIYRCWPAEMKLTKEQDRQVRNFLIFSSSRRPGNA